MTSAATIRIVADCCENIRVVPVVCFCLTVSSVDPLFTVFTVNRLTRRAARTQSSPGGEKASFVFFKGDYLQVFNVSVFFFFGLFSITETKGTGAARGGAWPWLCSALCSTGASSLGEVEQDGGEGREGRGGGSGWGGFCLPIALSEELDSEWHCQI